MVSANGCTYWNETCVCQIEHTEIGVYAFSRFCLFRVVKKRHFNIHVTRNFWKCRMALYSWRDSKTAIRDTLLLVGFEVITADIMKSSIFCDITACSPLEVYRRFGGTYQDRRIRQAWSRWQAEYCFTLVSFFGPNDRSDMFLRNVRRLPKDYMPLYPRT
jgi:hypothetical protein